MTIPTMELMLNIANIACHELSAGRKVNTSFYILVENSVLIVAPQIAVHCHAGFGRTGIAIACIMIVKDLLQASNVIPFIRKRR